MQELNGSSIASSATSTATLLTGGLDETFARIAGNQVTTLLTDALGSTLQETNSTQATTANFNYDAYGNTTTTGTVSNRQQFTGRENDGTGIYYYRARYYSPSMGRFLAEDPIGWNSGQANNYAYVGGDPVSFVDPWGEIVFAPIIIGAGAGYAFDYLLEQYKNKHCTCIENTAIGSEGSTAIGGAIGGTGPFADKPRSGVAGGGRAGKTTSSLSLLNHAAARRGLYPIATRNYITKILRKVPYAGTALASYGIYDAVTCK